MSIFSLHSRRIYSFIITLVVSPQDADEVFQNTSLTLWKKHDHYIPTASFWAWACQIAYYEVLRYRRSCNHRLVFSDKVLEQIAERMLPSEDKTLLREEALNDCVERLTRDDRELIELRYFHEKAPKQIAAIRNRSIQSVYRALGRIHDQLYRCVSQVLATDGE